MIRAKWNSATERVFIGDTFGRLASVKRAATHADALAICQRLATQRGGAVRLITVGLRTVHLNPIVGGVS